MSILGFKEKHHDQVELLELELVHAEMNEAKKWRLKSDCDLRVMNKARRRRLLLDHTDYDD